MKMFDLENLYLKKKQQKIDEDQSLKTHKKQTHYCSRLCKEERQKFFN